MTINRRHLLTASAATAAAASASVAFAAPAADAGLDGRQLGLRSSETEDQTTALQRAIDLGYRHLRHLCRDPDLKSLRRDPRFARLVRRSIGASDIIEF